MDKIYTYGLWKKCKKNQKKPGTDPIPWLKVFFRVKIVVKDTFTNLKFINRVDFDYGVRQRDTHTDGQTTLVLKSLSQPKM